MSRVAAGLLAGAAASFAAGCWEEDPGPLVPPTPPRPSVGFATPDRSSGVRLASLRISNKRFRRPSRSPEQGRGPGQGLEVAGGPGSGSEDMQRSVLDGDCTNDKPTTAD
jgi:hypothetical protein